ncbi:MAG: hypothetical protein LBV78_08510 [Kitasatospora sp.]|jgi:hypothetical protein|nr:hypothetical protein [Kitasatospora sp.]
MTQREQPPPPGDDVLEHAPGRWSPSRLADLPRWLLTGAAAVLLAGGGAALAASQNGHGRPGAERPAAPARADAEPGACGRFVNLSSFRIFPRYRLVLGDAALPPARLPPPSPSGHAAWPYGEQTAFEVHGGGPPVTIAVPQAWRDRVAVFGTTSRPPGFASTMRIPSCPPRAAWDIYVSDFYTRSRTACVPLRVQVRRQTMTLWFALGRRCRPGAR